MTYDYEVKIRHSTCIFLSLETLFLCGVILAFSSDELTFLKYHEISILNVIEFPVIVCAFPLFFTIMSIKSKAWYIFYEGLHVLIGLIFIPLLFTDTLISLIPFFGLSGRFIIYNLILSCMTKKSLKNPVKDIYDEELQDIIDKLDNPERGTKSDE